MSETDRLSMLDEFGSRRQIIPAEVKGRFRRYRTWVYWVLLLIFLGLPWIKINGMQALLLDIPNRRFEIFGMLFLAHDTPLLFFIFAGLALGLALVTAVWGRVWCGWACPQTVFIDAIYRQIEIWVEGKYIERRRLQAAPISWRKTRGAVLKWALFFLVSSLFAHSFIAYFTGSDRLIEMMQAPPGENWTYFVIVSLTTALLLFNFGWFREQFCIIMCPYGRFQSVLMDRSSVTVMYMEDRGEPRKGKVPPGQTQGDCVSCNRCVQVCPTGIDIRQGVQLECIACTACIDACDEIMRKVNKPEGLIRYASLSGEKASWLRPRVAAYAALIVVCLAGLLFSLGTRRPYHVAVLRAKDTPYQMVQNNQIVNHFKARLLNQSLNDQEFLIQLPDELTAEGVRLTQAKPSNLLSVGGAVEVHLFVTFPRRILNNFGETRLKLQIVEKTTGSIQNFEVIGVGPYSSGS